MNKDQKQPRKKLKIDPNEVNQVEEQSSSYSRQTNSTCNKLAIPHKSTSKVKAAQWTNQVNWSNCHVDQTFGSQYRSLLAAQSCNQFNLVQSNSSQEQADSLSRYLSDCSHLRSYTLLELQNEPNLKLDKLSRAQREALMKPYIQNVLWTAHFKPQRIDHVLVDKYDNQKIQAFKQWLTSYKIVTASQELLSEEDDDVSDIEYSRKSRKNSYEVDNTLSLKDGVFQLDGSLKTFEQLSIIPVDLQSKRQTHACLLYSPQSSCKTSLVYAAAQELNFDVVEVSAGSQPRGGADLSSAIGESVQSHNVKRRWLTSQKSSIKEFSQRKDSSNFYKQEYSNKDSLVLIEDVDILYKSDTGFWSTLTSLISQAQCPVVLTCSNLSQIPTNVQERMNQFDSKLKLLTVSQVDQSALADYLKACLLAQKVYMTDSDLQEFINATDGTLKSCLNQLDFQLRIAEPRQSYTLLQIAPKVLTEQEAQHSSDLAYLQDWLVLHYQFPMPQPLINSCCDQSDLILNLGTLINDVEHNDVDITAQAELQCKIQDEIGALDNQWLQNTPNDIVIKSLIPDRQTHNVYYNDYRPFILKILKSHHQQAAVQLTDDFLCSIDIGLRKRSARLRQNKNLEYAYFDTFYHNIDDEKKIVEDN